MSEQTLIEFYDGDATHPFASVRSQAVPRAGEFISIKRVTWQVSHVTWAIDTTSGVSSLRANVVCEKPWP